MNKEDGKKIVDEKTIKRRSWELDDETGRKLVMGLGIYLLAMGFILVFLPPVLIKYHLVSTALNPLWIGLFLAHFAGLFGYSKVTDKYCCNREEIDEMGVAYL